ncbi:hypothetical protein K431DRAFT_162096 [Polychaeton citri CBS 116435]|uniref:Secreted protein n=1 Tax=Polychaeton citri CBS 116435 TaxID=1314669 RepID=A0A9P4Q322_9PEZI|nr:hypothetical protein K431DRAFT_162096 [Polychaeton citri CBS 116435]
MHDVCTVPPCLTMGLLVLCRCLSVEEWARLCSLPRRLPGHTSHQGADRDRSEQKSKDHRNEEAWYQQYNLATAGCRSSSSSSNGPSKQGPSRFTMQRSRCLSSPVLSCPEVGRNHGRASEAVVVQY